MFDKNYMIDIDIDITSLKHKIAEKTLISYCDYSKEAKQVFDQINTIYQLMNVQLEEIDEAVTKQYIETKDYKLSKYAAITKIIRSVNNLFSEVLNTVALSNKSLMLNQIFRQMIEYFSIFNIITKHSDITAVLYMNHVHVLEYEAVKSKKDFIDPNLEFTHKACINMFAIHHNIDFKQARKEYSKPYGWAYRLLEKDDGDYHDYLNSRRVRDFVFKDYFSEKEREIFNLYIKTADMAVHPTPTYVYDLNYIDEEKSEYRKFIFDYSIGFYVIMLTVYQEFLKKNSTVDKLVQYSIKGLNELDKEIVYEDIIFSDDYTIINKYNKYSCITSNPVEKAKLLLVNFEADNVPILSYYESLHFLFYNLSSFQKKQYKELDRIYAITDSLFDNLYYFYPQIIADSNILSNIRHLYWIISFLNHELTVSYAFQKLPLFQKAYRLTIEYVVVLNKLLNSKEIINEAFQKLSYVLLEDSIYSDGFDKIKATEIVKELLTKLDLSHSKSHAKFKDFMGWTLHKNINGKIVRENLSQMTQKYIGNNDSIKEVFYVIWKECNQIMHAGLYGDEINNDLINNEYGVIDYVGILYYLSIQTIKDITGFTKNQNNEKLVESIHFLSASLVFVANKYSKRVEKLKKKINLY